MLYEFFYFSPLEITRHFLCICCRKQALLAAGADPSLVNSVGRTSLHLAMSFIPLVGGARGAHLNAFFSYFFSLLNAHCVDGRDLLVMFLFFL